jgi:hypothetical protein
LQLRFATQPPLVMWPHNSPHSVGPMRRLVILIAALACSPNTDGRPHSDAPPEEYAFLSEFGLSEESLNAAMDRLPYDSLTLWRDACFGTCPVYRITFRRTGQAHYIGEEHVSMLGSYSGDLSPFDYARLAYLLDDLDIMAIDTSYAAPVTDQPTATLTIYRRPTVVRVIRDYGEVGPIRLWAVRQLIDEIGSHIQWRPDSL